MNHIKLRFKRQSTCTCHRETLRNNPEKNLWRTLLCIRDLTSGSGIWEKTEDKHWDSSTAPQPRSRSWGGHTGWSPTILCPSFSLQPPCPPSLSLFLCFFLSSSFSLVCLPACAGAVYRAGPQWPWVINGDYGANGFLPSTFVCCSPLSLASLPLHCRNHCSQLKNCSTTMEGANPAVRVH